MAHYQSITDYLLGNGYEMDEANGGWFNSQSSQLPNGFYLPGYSFSFNYIAEMSNKHTVEEFSEIAKENGWVTETKPVVVPKVQVEKKEEPTTEDLTERLRFPLSIGTEEYLRLFIYMMD
jgi:hypothetical protein